MRTSLRRGAFVPMARPTVLDLDVQRIDHASVSRRQAQSADWLAIGLIDHDRHGLTVVEEIVLTPLTQRDEYHSQCKPLFREVIFVVSAAIGGRAHFQDPVRHQLPKAYAQNVLGEPEASLELPEPAGSMKGVADDQKRPPVANLIQ